VPLLLDHVPNTHDNNNENHDTYDVFHIIFLQRVYSILEYSKKFRFSLVSPLNILYTSFIEDILFILYSMYFRFTFLLLLALLLFPATARAYTDTTATPWYSRYYDKSLEQKVNNLDDTIVQDIPIPILFDISIGDFSPNFGVPRSGGRTHEGQDILAPIGTPLVSPTDAVVTYIMYGDSAGNSVYTANPGGETFAYLHLDSVNPTLAVGDVLHTGDLLGYVGDTGNAKGGPAHLHFEMLRDVPTDPFPRITRAFSLQEKMKITTNIYKGLNLLHAKLLTEFLLDHFEDEFLAAKQQGITLPDDIAAVLGQTTVASLSIHESSLVPARDLTIGSRGEDVLALQKQLLLANVGAAAQALADVGATGYFGALTKSAVLEYQLAYHITPANGYYGIETQQVLSPETHDEIPAPKIPIPEPITVTQKLISSVDVPQINLTNGDHGDAVTWLQTFLIEQHTGSVAAELQDVGATGYFGPLTTRALAEYQGAQGIRPAVGYYGSVTRQYIIGT